MHANKYNNNNNNNSKAGIPKEHKNNNGGILGMYVARDKRNREEALVFTLSSFVTF